MQAINYCAGVVGWLFGCGTVQSEAYESAEALFDGEELRAIKQQYHAHVLTTYSHGLDKQHLLEWCGLVGAPAIIGDGVFAAVCGISEGSDDGDIGAEGGAATGAAAAAVLAGGRIGASFSGGLGAGTGSCSLEDVVVAKARCDKMDEMAATEFAFKVVAGPEGMGLVSRERLEEVVKALLEMSLPPGMPPAALAASAAAIAAGALTPNGPGLGNSASPATSPPALDLPAFARWCSKVPAAKVVLTRLLSNIGSPTAATAAAEAAAAGPGPEGRPAAAHAEDRLHQPLLGGAATSGARPIRRPALLQLPVVVTGGAQQQQHREQRHTTRPGQESASSWHRELLLQPEWVWLLAPGLAPNLRHEWRLLFSSRIHGLSFNTFLGRLGEAAPTLLLLRDGDGCLFGGVAHAPWRRSGSFFGDYANKLVSFLPAACIYPASGINSNLQWCGSNFEQLPNGVGFGGQTGHFGLWIDSSFDSGHSRPNATYASPSLSCQQSFHIDAVEAWLLKPPDEEQEEEEARRRQRRGGQSILSQAKEDQNLLELAGVTHNYSANIPEPDDS